MSWVLTSLLWYMQEELLPHRDIGEWSVAVFQTVYRVCKYHSFCRNIYQYGMQLELQKASDVLLFYFEGFCWPVMCYFFILKDFAVRLNENISRKGLDAEPGVSHYVSEWFPGHWWRYASSRLNVVTCGRELIMMTSTNGNIFRITGPLCGEFTGHRWIPRTKDSDTELW